MKKRFIVMLILVLTMCVSCGKLNESSDEDAELKSSQMKAICELATLECYYRNVAKYNEDDATGIWLWKKDRKFWVEYSGIVTFGIDASKMTLNLKGNTASITIPKAKILSTKVDSKSLTKESFYIDNDSADVMAENQTEAYKKAEKNMKEKASSDTTLLASAQQSAQSLIEDYVNNVGKAIGRKYQIDWKLIENEEE